MRSGRLRCELQPDAGGAIAGLWRDAVPVLRSTPAGQLRSARQAACHPLVPFSNRIGQAAVVWHGTQQPLVRHPGDAPHTILGLAWQRPWSVLDEDGTSAMLACEHRSDASWPFAFDCSHTIRLQPDGLELILALTNQSSQPAPAGLGWRTVLPRAADMRLAWRAGGRGECELDRLPAVRHADAGYDGEAATLPLAECYEDWNDALQVRDAAVPLQVTSGLTRLLVCNAPEQDGGVGAPVSHAPNAVHLYAAGTATRELGLVLLQPGESLVAQMRITLQA